MLLIYLDLVLVQPTRGSQRAGPGGRHGCTVRQCSEAPYAFGHRAGDARAWSEGQLDASQEGVFAEVRHAAALAPCQVRVRVVERGADIAVQEPVQADTPDGRAGGQLGRVGEGWKEAVVDV